MSTEMPITEEKIESQPEQPNTNENIQNPPEQTNTNENIQNPPEQTNANENTQNPPEQTNTETTEKILVDESNPTVNFVALKELEGAIVSSFTELVKKVIILNGTPFHEITLKKSNDEIEYLKITNGRKKIYLKIIEDYAVLEFIGNKCRVAAVLEEKSVNKALNKAKKAKLQKRFLRV